MNDVCKLLKDIELNKYKFQEGIAYEDSLKYYRDLKSSMETYLEKGEKKAKVEIAKKLLKRGISLEIIAEDTELSVQELKELKNKLDNNEKL